MVEINVTLEKEDGDGQKTKQTIARSRIPVTDLSLCLDAQAHNKVDTVIAIGMEYIPDPSNLDSHRTKAQDKALFYSYGELPDEWDDHNLLSRCY